MNERLRLFQFSKFAVKESIMPLMPRNGFIQKKKKLKMVHRFSIYLLSSVSLIESL